MFGIDFSEILIIFGIALVVLGPEKLPKLANTIGRWVGRARAMARQFREQLEQETGGLHQGVNSLREGMDHLRKGMDLGPEFHGRSSAAGTTAAGTAAASAADAARADQRIRPAAPQAAPQATDSAAGATAFQPDDTMPPFGLADTHPAGLQPYEPAVSDAAPASAPHPTAAAPAAPSSAAPATGAAASAESSAAANTAAAEFPEPQQKMFWPPDGVL